MELEEAKRLLARDGVSPSVIVTKPYPKDCTEGLYRVVQQKIVDDTARLIVCRVPDSYR